MVSVSIGLRGSYIAQEFLCQVVGGRTGELENGVLKLNLIVGSGKLEVRIARGELDGDSQVVALLGRGSSSQC